LISGGAGLINTVNYQSADNVLNSKVAVAVLQHFQDWMQKGYIAPNTDGRAFINKRVALSWVGHWEYPRYSDAIGEHLNLIPLPDFGSGTRTAMGTWCWAITRNCKTPKAAGKFLEFLLRDQEVLAIIKANGAVPGTKTAVAKSELYQAQGMLSLFVAQLRTCAVPRAKTPAYPVITSVFQETMINILDGADVEKALDRAVQIIDETIKQNEGYRFPDKK
jgi:multiple sugar transport system substrate-binding protein